ncbi:MAG: hypothetical protein GF383_12295 [Candidatus Lokiarchaeota archaeon]|nr:hypothetical protein [Candidatus Lokiarchaeota archaeon]MBD3341772.1 hypothetical protein [Candidatus Lokiarchaeota archaeon]
MVNSNHYMDSFLNPESLCIFGANNEFLSTMGAMMCRNIIAGGFLKENLYPIHPKLSEVQGMKAYKSVLDLPTTPELALIILRPDTVAQVLEECGKKGIKRAIITSGGFREVGDVNLSQRISEIAQKYNMKFIGPNCLGVYNAWYKYPEVKNTRFNTMWIYEVPEKGNVSIIAHSGTLASHVFWYCKKIGLKIARSFSIGNEKDIDMLDILEYLKDDPYTKVIGLYIEEIKRGNQFIELAKEITPHKPIVAIYAGGTEAATRSIMGHTGAIAGDNKIYEAVFKESGIISTFSIENYLYYLRTFSQGVIPKGKRIALVTSSGGSGSMLAKTAELHGLEVPEFSEELKEQLREYAPEIANLRNPLDLTFVLNQYNSYVKIPKILIKSGEIDGIIVYAAWGFEEVLDVIKQSSGKSYDEFDQLDNKLMKRIYIKPTQRLVMKTSIPIFYIGPQGYSNSWIRELLDSNIPVFDLWDQPVKCFSVLAQYAEYRKKLCEKSL